MKLHVRAAPNARHSEVIGWENDARSGRVLRVRVAAPPVEGKANAELRDFLAGHLAAYMIPEAFIPVPGLPIKPDGRVDRQALPRPEAGFIEGERTYVAPQKCLEAVLCNIWREVLNLERVGVKDNFFNLGGNSLLAVRLIDKINQKLKTNLHVPAFFQNPTIELLAAVLGQAQIARLEPQLISLQPGRSEGALFFLDAGVGLCRLAEMLDSGPPIFATVVPLSPAAIQAASLGRLAELPSMEELAAPHTALILGRQHKGACMIAGHSFGGLLAFEVAHQLQRAGRPVELIFLLDTLAKKPAWWNRLRALTFQNLAKSIQFRAMRVLSKNHAEPALPRPLNRNVSLAFGEVPWEILSKIYGKARGNYRRHPVQSRALLFRARQNEGAQLSSIDRNLGWSGLFSAGLEVIDCPGDHFTMLKMPNMQFLARQFQENIESENRTAGT